MHGGGKEKRKKLKKSVDTLPRLWYYLSCAETARQTICASGGIGRLAGFRCQCSQGRAGSTPASRTSSSQATYRLRRVFSFYCKAHRALILLRLASKSQPLALGCDLVQGADLWLVRLFRQRNTRRSKVRFAPTFFYARLKKDTRKACLFSFFKGACAVKTPDRTSGCGIGGSGGGCPAPGRSWRCCSRSGPEPGR